MAPEDFSTQWTDLTGSATPRGQDKDLKLLPVSIQDLYLESSKKERQKENVGVRTLHDYKEEKEEAERQIKVVGSTYYHGALYIAPWRQIKMPDNLQASEQSLLKKFAALLYTLNALHRVHSICFQPKRTWFYLPLSCSDYPRARMFHLQSIHGEFGKMKESLRSPQMIATRRKLGTLFSDYDICQSIMFCTAKWSQLGQIGSGYTCLNACIQRQRSVLSTVLLPNRPYCRMVPFEISRNDARQSAEQIYSELMVCL